MACELFFNLKKIFKRKAKRRLNSELLMVIFEANWYVVKLVLGFGESHEKKSITGRSYKQRDG